ncbi:MAG: tetratricopeptide repeat protein, partial [Flammeovirgaceae bacterium]
IQFTFGDRPSFWEKSSIANALNSLNQRGWLDLREGKYKCHGIIREVVYQDVNNTLYKFYEACCTNLASHAHYSGQYMLAFLINNNMLRFMDIHSFTKKHDQKRFYLYADIVQNLGNLGLVPLALEYIEEGKKYIDTVSNYKKTSWAVEGFKIYVQTGNSKLYNKAKKHVKASLEEFPLRKKEAALHMKYHSFIARWYFQKQEYAKSIKELEKSKKICEEYKVHKIHYIRILGALGEGYFKLKKYADTVLYSEESLRLSREIFGHNEHPKDEDTIDILQQARKLLKRKEAKRKLKK